MPSPWKAQKTLKLFAKQVEIMACYTIMEKILCQIYDSFWDGVCTLALQAV